MSPYRAGGDKLSFKKKKSWVITGTQQMYVE